MPLVTAASVVGIAEGAGFIFIDKVAGIRLVSACSERPVSRIEFPGKGEAETGALGIGADDITLPFCSAGAPEDLGAISLNAADASDAAKRPAAITIAKREEIELQADEKTMFDKSVESVRELVGIANKLKNAI